MSERFPIGGSKAAVAEFMSEHGFRESGWSDKSWVKGDVQAHVYKTGSWLRISVHEWIVADGTIESAMAEYLEWEKRQSVAEQK